MSELAPFAPGRAHRNPTYDFALPGVTMPPCLALQAPFRKLKGFVAFAIVLWTIYVLESSASLWLAVPNAIAESLSLAGPLDVHNVPVEAPGLA